MQEAAAQSAAELAQLRSTVDELRRALVAAQEDARRGREALERNFRHEREQLQGTIAALRSRLEMTDGD